MTSFPTPLSPVIKTFASQTAARFAIGEDLEHRRTCGDDDRLAARHVLVAALCVPL